MTEYILTAVVFIFLAALSLFALAEVQKPPEFDSYMEMAPPVEVTVDPAVVAPQTVVSAEPQEPPSKAEERVEELVETVEEIQIEQKALNETVKQLTKDIKEGKVKGGQAYR